jgi:hypothetical protein
LNNQVQEIQAEAQRVERLIKRTTDLIDSSESDLPELVHLQLCRAEQQAYLAGLRYALGNPTMLDRLAITLDLASD